MGRRLSLAIAAAGLLAALAILLIGRRSAPDDLRAAAADLDALIRENAAGVQARTDTLAQLPRLGWAVATDETTVRDLTAEELAFRTHPGEHIEISQARKSDGALRRLLHLPADGGFELPTAPGTHLLVQDNQLYLVTVTNVEPRQRADELLGILAVAKRLDLSPIAQRLTAHGIDAAVRTGQGTVAIAGDMSGASVDATMPLRGPGTDGAELVAAKVRRALGPRIAAWTILLLSLAAAGWLWRRDVATTSRRVERSAQPSRAPAAPIAAAEPRPAPSDLSPLAAEPAETTAEDLPGGELTPIQVAPPAPAASLPPSPPSPIPVPPVPAATRRLPSPVPLPPPTPSLPPPLPPPTRGSAPARTPIVGSPARTPIVGTPIHEPGSRPSHVTPAAGKAATAGIPSVDRPRQRSLSGHVDVSLARSGLVAMATRPAPAGSAAVADPRTDEYRALFAEFVAMRRTTGEPVEGMNASQFIELLREKRAQLIKELAVKDVRFRLAFQNGKAAIRYQTVS